MFTYLTYTHTWKTPIPNDKVYRGIQPKRCVFQKCCDPHQTSRDASSGPATECYMTYKLCNRFLIVYLSRSFWCKLFFWRVKNELKTLLKKHILLYCFQEGKIFIHVFTPEMYSKHDKTYIYLVLKNSNGDMKNISFLICILVWWFFLNFFIFFEKIKKSLKNT